MPWEFKKNQLPRWHDHPFKIPKETRDALAPLVLITRKQWGALPKNDDYPMELPVNYVRYIHTATEGCTTKKKCIKVMRALQTQHMREGMPDINYNFLIGGDGAVYEGRGWELDSNRDFDTWHSIEAECYDIAYIGQYERLGENIPEVMTKQAESLVVYGVDKKYINCCYKTIPFDTNQM